MPNNLMVVIGCVLIFLSNIIFGAVPGTIIGMLVLFGGAFAGNDYEGSVGSPNFKVIFFGAVITFFSLFVIGGIFGVVIGLLVMLAGIYFSSETPASYG